MEEAQLLGEPSQQPYDLEPVVPAGILDDEAKAEAAQPTCRPVEDLGIRICNPEDAFGASSLGVEYAR